MGAAVSGTSLALGSTGVGKESRCAAKFLRIIARKMTSEKYSN